MNPIPLIAALTAVAVKAFLDWLLEDD